MDRQRTIFTLKMCKNHPDHPATYFTQGQPWHKMCKQCALNRALCGYKIDRELAPHEFENKLTLNSLIDEIKAVLATADLENQGVTALMTRLEKEFQDGSAVEAIKQIDKHIQDLCSLRDSISKTYDEQVRQKMTAYCDHQSQLLADTMSLKKHLENVETNFCDLIQNSLDKEETVSLTSQVSTIKQEIQKIRKSFFAIQQEDQLEEKIKEIKKTFEEKINNYKHKLTEMCSCPKKREKDAVIIKADKAQKVQRQNSKTSRKQNRQISASKDYKCYSHRKRSTPRDSMVDESVSSVIGSQMTRRPTNLSLRNFPKRNNSIQNNMKVQKPFEDSLRFNCL